MGRLGRATCIVHSSSAQTSHKGIKCTKAKEQLRPYCPNIYTVQEGIKCTKAKEQLRSYCPKIHMYCDVDPLRLASKVEKSAVNPLYTISIKQFSSSLE